MPVPGKQFVDALGGVIGDTGQHIGKVVLRVKAIEFSALDQRVHRCSTSATGIGSGKEIIFAADCDAAQRALGRIVAEREPAVVEAAD